MIHGEDDDIEELRERAKAVVVQHFVRIAESDGTPPTLRACYVMKESHAERVLDGGTSAFIEQEAELRGYTPYEMARIVVFMAGEAQEMELARTRANIAIEQAEDESGIVAALAQIGLELPEDRPLLS